MKKDIKKQKEIPKPYTDDFVTDSTYSADSHISYYKLQLANMKLKINKLSNGYSFHATFKLQEDLEEGEKDLLEKYEQEAEKLAHGHHLSRKLFQFRNLLLYATLVFLKKENFYYPALANSKNEVDEELTGDVDQY